MRSSVEFLVGLLDRDDPAAITQEDFKGTHGLALRRWQDQGFIEHEPAMNPVTSCPECEEGVPYQVEGRLVCSRCCSTVDPASLLVWTVTRDAFFGWLASALHLRGGVRRIDENLTQLGTWESDGAIIECFFCRPGPLSDSGRARLGAYRSVLIFFGLCPPGDAEREGGRCVSLLEVLSPDDPLAVRNLRLLLNARGALRFEPHSGALWVGDTLLGEVPVGSKEYFFLRCLAERLDQFVPYADIKHEVVYHAGSSDETEEATFCHRLKSRIKRAFIPQIDSFVVTTNKAEGYRLRGRVEVPGRPNRPVQGRPGPVGTSGDGQGRYHAGGQGDRMTA